MNQLLQDIKIWIDPEIQSNPIPRYCINTGSEQINPSSKHATRYCSNEAFIPKPTWRVLTSIERELVQVDDNKGIPYDRLLEVIQIPTEITRPIFDMGIALANNQEHLQDLGREMDEKGLLTPLMRMIDQRSIPQARTQPRLWVNGFSWIPPDFPTTTIDGSKQECLVGLHLDSWDKLSIAERHRATNRVCINFSQEDRYLLFLNLSMKTTVKILKNKYGHAVKIDTSKASKYVSLFLKNFPYYPVLKLRIAPGEAYIAPTENMIHDGCSEGMREPSVTFTVRGKFH